MFMSDNGAEPGRRDLVPPISEHVGKEYDHSVENLGRATSYVMYGRNWASVSASPFHRHKGTAFQGGVKVPAFVRFPGVVAAGTRSNATGTVRDLLPTFLALAGATPPEATFRGQPVLPVQGKSLLPVLRGEATAVHAPDEVFAFEQSGHRSVRQGDWKIVWDRARPEPERRWQLFNLATDPAEQHDASAAEPERLAQLIAAWERYEAENGVIY
jgi:arylsulfatase